MVELQTWLDYLEIELVNELEFGYLELWNSSSSI